MAVDTHRLIPWHPHKATTALVEETLDRASAEDGYEVVCTVEHDGVTYFLTRRRLN